MKTQGRASGQVRKPKMKGTLLAPLLGERRENGTRPTIEAGTVVTVDKVYLDDLGDPRTVDITTDDDQWLWVLPEDIEIHPLKDAIS